MRTILIVALLASSSGAHAQTLYKCAVKGKPTSYQSEPCASGNAAKTWHAPLEASSNGQQRRADNAAPTAAENARIMARLAGTGGRQGQQATIPLKRSNACDIARANREAILGRNNQGGNVDSRRVLNEQVARHCY